LSIDDFVAGGSVEATTGPLLRIRTTVAPLPAFSGDLAIDHRGFAAVLGDNMGAAFAQSLTGMNRLAYFCADAPWVFATKTKRPLCGHDASEFFFPV
jgi:hypothetical protein